MELPYSAEYAKSGRSKCHSCKWSVQKGTLRLAVLVQSPFHDGKIPNWYHSNCFFTKFCPQSENDIHHFETLRIEDQNEIREKINAEFAVILPDTEGKGRKRDASAIAAKEAALKNFKIEYSKSSADICRGCRLKIMRNEVRILKKGFEKKGAVSTRQNLWHHLSCFAELRADLGYFESAVQLPGFQSLSEEDQEQAKKELPAVGPEDVPDIKKARIDNTPEGLTEEESKLYAEQNKLVFECRDELEKGLTKNEMVELLQFNNQEVPPGQDRILDSLADNMVFGALLPCSVCKGQLVFDKFGYKCHGDLTEWTKCNTVVKEPPRTAFKIPKNLKNKAFLKKYKYKARTRVVKNAPSPSSSTKTDDQPKVTRQAPPLYDMKFVILGKPQRGRNELTKQIKKLGGTVCTKIDRTVTAVIASEEDVKSMERRMKTAKDNQLYVVPEEFVDEAPERSGSILELIQAKTICDWGLVYKPLLPYKPHSECTCIMCESNKVKLTVKGDTAVDPESGLDHVAHVYTYESDKYTAVLSKTDIQTKQNGYYKLQLLAADIGCKFWVFRSWGRIGTTIGGNAMEPFFTLGAAEREFCRIYEEKTGNAWENRHSFRKIPGKFYPVDVDYGGGEDTSTDVVDAPSTLPVPVQELMALIFDVDVMQKVMRQFELDTEKMPLGKLSKKQIMSAYSVLTELQQLVESGGPQARIIDATNRFYTLVPHSFGLDAPPIINNMEMIKQKADLLDTLLELEITYSMMQSSAKTADSYYKQLNTEIDVLSKDSEEFKLIQAYAKNTHSATHSGYSLEIKDVFTITRHDETDRFEPFKKLHNRKLLWHGSRRTNFAGILSQGLRIAPPEAPSTGYMFGKGIYFADMVSKSANYCRTWLQDPTGLLLLCDVALGNMYEKTKAEYVRELPEGKHSTKGVGRTEPDPKASKTLDGVEVPLGKDVTHNDRICSLIHNEYIVYDVAQVNMKYLLKVEFKYKY